MKTEHKIGMIVTLSILGLALLAAETQFAKESKVFAKGSKVYLLKSGGDTVAELRVRAGAECEIKQGDPSEPLIRYPSGEEREMVRVVLRIGTGTNYVKVSAPDIETASEAK